MLLEATEVATRLGITRGTVYKLLATDSTFPRPIHVTPKNPRWRAPDLDAWLERKAAA